MDRELASELKPWSQPVPRCPRQLSAPHWAALPGRGGAGNVYPLLGRFSPWALIGQDLTCYVLSRVCLLTTCPTLPKRQAP